ncbi:MAG: aminopeptidase P family N-terminal domain-containing protein, partial [Gammaproteobacteria bacterium]|nr:aminopeptidase P family N-terminal domain-containing protein [Gammaproteobacteria bacterium]
MNSSKKVAALRGLMKTAGIAAYYIPSSDPHQSEYVPACWERRQWISGFTGSAGDVLIGRKKAGLWTDGRYFLQAETQLKDSGIELFRSGEPGVPTLDAFVAKTLQAGESIGFDPAVVPRQRVMALTRALEGTGVNIKALPGNLVDAIWNERPSASGEVIKALPVKFAGENVGAKLKRLRKRLSEASADALIVSTLDSIAWLFNIRGQDVSYNPVAIAYAIVERKRATLFVDQEKVTPALRKHFGTHVTVAAYEDFEPALKQLGSK